MLCHGRPLPRRQLTTDELSQARRAYEFGVSYQALADRHGISKATMIAMLRSVGVVWRPVGFQRLRPVVVQQPRPVVEPAPDAFGLLRIPCRTSEERRVPAWTPPERQAIDQALRAGLAQRAVIGRLGPPERPLRRRGYGRWGIAPSASPAARPRRHLHSGDFAFSLTTALVRPERRDRR